MPDHVKTKLNRAYPEDKVYNDIVLHFDRKMRLNGLGTPDEITLVSINKVQASQPPIETKPVENRVQNNKIDTAFTARSFKLSTRKVDSSQTLTNLRGR